MIKYLLNLLNVREDDERGASAVEYGLLVAGIAAVIVGVVFLLGGTLNTAFTDTEKCVAGKGAAASCPVAN